MCSYTSRAEARGQHSIHREASNSLLQIENTPPHSVPPLPSPNRRPYSRLALLALFPSLAAVDSVDITSEEKRLSEAMAGGSSGVGIVTAPSNANSNGAWGLAIPGISNGGGGGGSVAGVGGNGSGGGGSGGGVVGGAGGGVPSTIGLSRREYVTVGSVGSITRKSAVATQGGGMGGWAFFVIARNVAILCFVLLGSWDLAVRIVEYHVSPRAPTSARIRTCLRLLM